MTHDEFRFLPAQSKQLGLTTPVPRVRRDQVSTPAGEVSALVWGAQPTVTFLHGAGLNAHTWDATVLALGSDAIALDLPGHGSSDWRDDFDYRPEANVPAIIQSIETWSHGERQVIVGQSLGGLSALAAYATRPELVRAMVIVDVTPGLTPADSAQVREFLAGPQVFASREEIVDKALAAGIGSSRSDLERGVELNTCVRDDGTVVFRHHLASPPEGAAVLPSDFTALWAAVESADVPVLLVRGVQGFLAPALVAEFRARVPRASLVEIDAGHNVQEQQPAELARAIGEFTATVGLARPTVPNWRLGGVEGISIGATNSIADVPGISVGHASRTGEGWLTGSTVVLAPEGGMVAGVDVRGGGTATRETPALDPTGVVQRIQAVHFSGGSAYGLDSTAGVMSVLQEHGRGFRVGPEPRSVVPIVPAASIFDLGRGGDFDNRPDAELAARATRRAFEAPAVDQGSVGAATGAIAGEMRGAIGTASAVLPGGVVVAALVIVNAAGSTIDLRTGAPWGLFAELPLVDGSGEFGIQVPTAEEHAAARARLTGDAAARPALRPLNTTLAVIATTADLDRAQLTKLAGTAHDGMARAVRPVHTLGDGDVVFAVSPGGGGLPTPSEGLLPDHVLADSVNQVLTAGADVLTRAIVHAILSAESTTTPSGPVPSYRELYPEATAGYRPR